MENIIEKRASLLDRPLIGVVALDWYKLAYAAVILFTVVTRFWDLGSRAQHHDESMHAFYSWELFQGRGYIHNPLLHGPFLFHITALVYFLLGASDYTARVAPALFGVGVVILPYFLQNWLGRKGALATSLLFAISPGFLYYTRFIRHDVFAAGFELLLFFTLVKYLEERRDIYLYLGVAALSLLYSTMEIGFITSFIFTLFLWLVLGWLAGERARGPGSGVTYLLFTLMLLLAAALSFLLLMPQTIGILALLAAGLGLAVLQAPAFSALYRRVFQGWKPAPLESAVQDLVVILVTFTITLSSALPMRFLGVDPMSYVEQVRADPASIPVILSDPTFTKVILVFLAVLALVSALGILWDRRRWLTSAGIFFAIYLVLHTTFLTNILGVLTGMIGSLGYWLAQHDVRRGNQPAHYYAVLLSLYEFLPLLLAIAGSLAYLLRGIKRVGNRPAPAAVHSSASEPTLTLTQLFTPWLILWSVMALGIYSWAGEKMPWLSVHLILPLILLAGNTLGRWLDAPQQAVWKKPEAWALAVLLAMALLVALASAFAFPTFADFPTLGPTLDELNRSMRFLGYLVVLLAVGYLGWRLLRQIGGEKARTVILGTFLGGMALLTQHFSFIAAYQHGDIAKDMLIYTQTSPDVTMIMKEIDSLSMRLAGGKSMSVAFDDFTSWPFWWYLRDYPNKIYFGAAPSVPLDAPVVMVGLDNEPNVRPYLGDYIRQQYRLRWWFPEEGYRQLSLETVQAALQNPQGLEGVVRFLLYREIDQPLGSSDFAFYLRRDIAQQLWRSSVVPLSPEVALGETYSQARIDHPSVAIFGLPGLLNLPKNLAVDSEGRIYILDSGNHRLQVLDKDGAPLFSWGRQGSASGQFNEPWGIALDNENGWVYVADTWNHRIQKFDLQGNFLTEWGGFYDSEGQAQGGQGQFYGPRGIVLDGEGNLYVTDTGNKRIQKFGPAGEFLGQWGGEGTSPGQFREPVGIAVSGDGKIFVADTWNQRIQVFDHNMNFLAEWPIQAWRGSSVDNKPYLAVDVDGQVWVSDPEGHRILVFDEGGEILAVFGKYGNDASSFSFPLGLTFGREGHLYAADSANNRVMKFPPIP